MLWYICLIISALIIAVTVPLFVRMRVFKRKKAVVSYQDSVSRLLPRAGRHVLPDPD
nr:hypothetical protein [uncultured Ruminococcus sp.]